MSNGSEEQSDHPALDDYSIDSDYIDPPQNPSQDAVSVSSDEESDTTDEGLYRHRDASDASESNLSDTHGDLSEISPSSEDGTSSVDTAGSCSVSAPSIAASDADESVAEDSRGWQYRRGPGTLSASSMDETIDHEAVVSNDGRSYTRTTFYPWEAEGDTHMADRGTTLALMNDGWRSKERSSQNSQATRTRTIDTLGTCLDCTSFQIERTESIIASVDVSHMGPYTTEAVVLAALSLACNEDGRWVRDEDRFRQMCADTDTTLSDVRACRNLLRKKSEVL